LRGSSNFVDHVNRTLKAIGNIVQKQYAQALDNLNDPAQQMLQGRLAMRPLLEAVREPPLKAGGLQQLCRII